MSNRRVLSSVQEVVWICRFPSLEQELYNEFRLRGGLESVLVRESLHFAADLELVILQIFPQSSAIWPSKNFESEVHSNCLVTHTLGGLVCLKPSLSHQVSRSLPCPPFRLPLRTTSHSRLPELFGLPISATQVRSKSTDLAVTCRFRFSLPAKGRLWPVES